MVEAKHVGSTEQNYGSWTDETKINVNLSVRSRASSEGSTRQVLHIFTFQKYTFKCFYSRTTWTKTQRYLINNLCEKSEIFLNIQIFIFVYKQKLKHVLSEQHSTVSELKMAAVSSSSMVQNQNMEAELGLCRDVQNLQADRREKEFHEESSIKELKHQVELMELNNKYERRLREMEVKNHRRMQSLAEVEEKKRRSEVIQLEDQMKSRVASLIEDHDRALRQAEEFYSQVQSKQLKELQELKEELLELQKQEVRLNRDLSAAQQENRRLTEVLQEAQQKLPELQRRLQEQNRAKDTMKHRAHLKLVEKELRDLTVENQLLLQAFQKVQQERDELLRRQTESLLEVRQRSGLKKMLLQKKLAALTETLEKKEAQLGAALSVSSTDPTARSHAADKLEETLESKRVAIESLKEDLARESKVSGFKAVLLSFLSAAQVVTAAMFDLQEYDQLVHNEQKHMKDEKTEQTSCQPP
uniref:Dynein regulatory complex subunit 4 n=1 Tax=Kryptolebias marmoratus TaxID=37003 RepID=A0A3Q3FJL8_KRYMA